MEPAPLSADEIDQPIAPADAIDHTVSALDAAHAAGEDVEPPYLRLRTLVDESLVKETESQHTPALDLTEFAVLAENTGVEVRGDAPPPAFPRTLIADVASFPHAMPTGLEPSTELLMPAKKGLTFSRTRLVGWGAVAFCAGLVASAAAHMIAAPARIGATANAASAIAATSTPPAASAMAPVAVPTPPPAPAVAAPAAADTEAAPAKTVADGTQADSQPALAASAPVRTRSGATAQARGQTRARGKMRSVPRTGSADDPFAAEAKPAPAAADAEPAAPAPAKQQHKAGWVDPFAE